MSDACATTVADALGAARRLGVERLDALALLSVVLDRPRSWLLAHDEAALDTPTWRRLEVLLARRAAGEPLAYLLGEKEFFGLPLAVTPAVLVPRPDTETLVEWALELLQPRPAATVLDLGTGSGAVALALAHRCPEARVTGVDISPAALAVAAGNGRRLERDVEWLPSDWFDALSGRRFDLIVGNPPYIAAGDPHLPDLRHEPEDALVSGPDGLDALRRITAQAAGHLQVGGWLLVEHGWDQAAAVTALFESNGFLQVSTRTDLAGQPRCSGGRWLG